MHQLKFVHVSKMSILKVFLLLISVVTLCHTEKILFLLPLASRSHVHVFEPLMQALGERGHTITTLSPIVSPNMPPNVKQIQIISLDDILSKLPNMFESRRLGAVAQIFNSSSLEYIKFSCEKVLQSPIFHKVANEKFDLVIVDALINFCALGILPIIQAPLIHVTTMAAPSFYSVYLGNRMPPSIVPCFLVKYTDSMTFGQRMWNTVLDMYATYFWRRWLVPQYEEMYKKYLPNGENLPGLHEIMGNASMIFMNSHFTVNRPKPLLPDVIEVGGLHIRPAKKLPKDLDNFLTGSGKEGFIFFSLGSVVNTTELPESYRKVFINVFAKLKQRVLWKWESEVMPDLPSNVKLGRWLPQQDILAHPNIRIFMTHGGLLSTQESLYHGVPVIGLPLFGDQDLNIQQAEAKGYAKFVEIVDISEEKLETAINELLNNPSYTSKAKELSKLVQDLPEKPLDKAVYWTEYVLRHKGAKHLRSAARDLNFFQYYALDIAAALLTISGVILFTILICCKSMYRRVCCCSTRNTHLKND